MPRGWSSVEVVAPARRRRLDLDALALRWERALDAADRALVAAQRELTQAELGERAKELVVERREVVIGLAHLATAAGLQAPPLLSPVPLRPAMLGLPDGTRACLFDLEGVLTDGSALHAWAWGEAFDDFLRRFGDRAGRVLEPFDRGDEYRAFVDGRPRVEGVQTLLRSRGIRLPLGEPDDPSGIDTVHALARQKSEVLTHRLETEGVTALPGARRYLEAVGYLGLGRAVLSASVRTETMLEAAGLAPLVEERVDADRIRHEDLRSRPAPDAVLSVCRHLGVEPSSAIAFTSSPLGVAAALAAGVGVVGVATGRLADALEEAGAGRVVASLVALLDPRLAVGL